MPISGDEIQWLKTSESSGLQPEEASSIERQVPNSTTANFMDGTAVRKTKTTPIYFDLATYQLSQNAENWVVRPRRRNNESAFSLASMGSQRRQFQN
jgi:hypothetical protein